MAKAKVEFKPAPSMHNRVAEEELVGAMMADGSVYLQTAHVVKEEHFYYAPTQFIRKAADRCYEKGVHTTRSNIYQEILSMNAGDVVTPEYLQMLDDKAYPSVIRAAEEHALNIFGMYKAREAKKMFDYASDQIAQSPGELSTVLQDVQSKTAEFMHSSRSGRERGLFMDEWNPYEQQKMLKGSNTRLWWVNDVSGGHVPAMVHGIVGFPKRGKTRMGRNILLHDVYGSSPEDITKFLSYEEAQRRVHDKTLHKLDWSWLNPSPISWFSVDGTSIQALSDLAITMIIGLLDSWMGRKKRFETKEYQGQEYRIDKWAIKPEQPYNPEYKARPEVYIATQVAFQLRPKGTMRMYDSASQFRDLSRLLDFIRSDAMDFHKKRKSGTPSLLVLDYVQNITNDSKKTGSWSESDFEQSIKDVCPLARSLDMTTYVYSQPNTTASNNWDDENYGSLTNNPKEKGGGALRQEVDFMWAVKIHSEKIKTQQNNLTESTVQYSLIDSRRGAMGFQEYQMIPENGYILNPDEGKPQKYQAAPGY